MPTHDTKVGQIALQAQAHAERGLDPADAWLRALQVNYSGKQLVNQRKHTCPKLAFLGLGHAGHIRGVEGGSAPQSETSNSASYALKALDELRRNPDLAHSKADLKESVFRDPEAGTRRTPNGEIEVLLALWESQLVR